MDLKVRFIKRFRESSRLTWKVGVFKTMWSSRCTVVSTACYSTKQCLGFLSNFVQCQHHTRCVACVLHLQPVELFVAVFEFYQNHFNVKNMNQHSCLLLVLPIISYSHSLLSVGKCVSVSSMMNFSLYYCWTLAQNNLERRRSSLILRNWRHFKSIFKSSPLFF